MNADDAVTAKQSLDEAFAREIAQGHINAVTIIEDMSIVAAVGDGMAQMPGVAGRFFNALGNAQINIVAVAQGCDEKNISTIVSSQDTERALRAIHSSFLLSEITVSVGIIFGDADVASVCGSSAAGVRFSSPSSGRGSSAKGVQFDADNHIGFALLTLLLERRQWLQTRFESDIRVRGVMTKVGGPPVIPLLRFVPSPHFLFAFGPLSATLESHGAVGRAFEVVAAGHRGHGKPQ